MVASRSLLQQTILMLDSPAKICKEGIFYVKKWKYETKVCRPRWWLSYSPLDPRFAGSNPAGVDGFYQSVKILSMASFGREVKPVSRVVDLRYVKEPHAEIRASEQNLSDFSRSL